MELTELFWSASFEEMKRGFVEEEDRYTCLLCGKHIEKGIIYPAGSLLYEAGKYMAKHIEDEHGSVFEYLNLLDKKMTGLSEHQSRLLGLFYNGKSDSEVQKVLNIGSASTIRNHRFALKEKEKQARIYLVMMELLKEKNKKAMSMVSPHQTAKMVDDRYSITEDENEKLLKRYFPEGKDGKLSTFSMQEKHKVIVLREIVKRFESGRTYTEKELNEILKKVYEYDYVAIRRYLIEYGFMDRKDDCSLYWVKEAIGNQDSLKTAGMVASGVYQIRNTQNGKIYISTARNISNLNGIRFELNVGSYRNKLLQSEWKQYGGDAFVFETLESFEENGNAKEISKKLREMEMKWIAKLQPFGERGYNK